MQIMPQIHSKNTGQLDKSARRQMTESKMSKNTGSSHSPTQHTREANNTLQIVKESMDAQAEV